VIHIVIADDHHLVRQGLRALLEKHADIEVTGEAQNGQEALDAVQRLRPEVLILDINMPGLNGMEVTKRVREAGWNTQVLILSMYSDESYVKKALRYGARGYLHKRSITEDLFDAIFAVYMHQTYVSPTIPGNEDGKLLNIHPADQVEDEFDRLTSREREVCQLIAEGNTNQLISHKLGISVKTVEKHRANVMAKLGVNDIASLTREAIRHGIVFLDR
jgi:DNA-binding NarL/FixJ family response regulator